jgi:probable O-glycosylation ligase (exosortase A-associated)
MLRTIFVVIIIVYGITQSLRGPFYALLFYLWFAYFRPEQWIWSSFLSTLNISFIVGVYVLVRTVFSREKLRFGIGPALMLLFLAQSFTSTFMSDSFDWSWPYFTDFVKSTLISFLIVTLVTTEERVRSTMVVITLSLGFEAAKQGWVQLVLNPGSQNINESVMLGDNNGVAVGMCMLVPIVTALARTSARPLERFFHRFVAFGVLYRGVVTYSRGGFIAFGTLGIHHIIRSKRKLGAMIGVVVVAALIVPILPDVFWNRMDTIPESQEELEETTDGSIQGRLHFWRVAVVMANDRPLVGVGHNAYNDQYNRYDFSLGRFRGRRSVHSMWLGVLAELGYPGLIIFVAILAFAFWQCARVRRLAARRPDLANLAIYAAGIEAALLAVTVGGTFVIFQYVEFLWHCIALSIAVSRIAAKTAPAEAPVAAVDAPIGRPLVPAVAMARLNPQGSR